MALRLELCPPGMAELTMRQLEADSAKEQPGAKGLLRPKAAYEAAIMLVDASQHAWKVLYIDSQASAVTGNFSAAPTRLLDSPPCGTRSAIPMYGRSWNKAPHQSLQCCCCFPGSLP